METYLRPLRFLAASAALLATLLSGLPWGPTSIGFAQAGGSVAPTTRPNSGPMVAADVAKSCSTGNGNASKKPPCKAGPRPVTGLHVRGNQILNGAGQVVRLVGVDRGAANACIQGWGIFSGPTDVSTVQAMATWKINAVRIPLNEDCWLGINRGKDPSKYFGSNYRQAITSYVAELSQFHMATILDLHWNAPGDKQAGDQQPMADQDHAPAFWKSVSATFKRNSSVVFDLYNEPYPDNNSDSAAAWTCLKKGGACPGVPFKAAGMQELVNVVRKTGARNLLLVGGVGWAGIMDHWLQYRPNDPLRNIAASVHIYPGTWCHDQGCWQSQIAPVAKQVPLVVGEFGETDCKDQFVDKLMTWLDGRGASYLAWHWWPDTQVGCDNFPLIHDYDGTPNEGYGKGIHEHFVKLGLGGYTPTAAVDSDKPMQLDFEDGTTDGWHVISGRGTLKNTKTHAYTGKHSLAWAEQGGADWLMAYESTDVVGLAPGVTITGEVYSPAENRGLSFGFLTYDGSSYHNQGAVSLHRGWNRVSWTIPPQKRIVCLGGQLNDPNGWSGEVDLDAVRLG